MRAYLDHNATSPVRPSVLAGMTGALSAAAGNPSSLHEEGRAARALMEKAREQVASAVKGKTKGVVFVSGATEALNTLLRPSPAVMGPGGRSLRHDVLVSRVEHSAALGGGHFSSRTHLPVDPSGVVDRGALREALLMRAQDQASSPAMVVIQHANSETGVIQPLGELAGIVHESGGVLICDCVASFGKIPIDINILAADALVISAHKFGGPKGTGAIILNGDRLHITEPLFKGGGQERRVRSGTENVPAIVGFGIAAEEASRNLQHEADRMRTLRDRLLVGLRAARPDLIVFAEQAHRLPQVLLVALPDWPAETALIALDLAGVAISSGSACSSGKVAASHVLAAMGVEPALARCALRFSLGWSTTDADIDHAITTFARLVPRGQTGKAA